MQVEGNAYHIGAHLLNPSSLLSGTPTSYFTVENTEAAFRWGSVIFQALSWKVAGWTISGQLPSLFRAVSPYLQQ